MAVIFTRTGLVASGRLQDATAFAVKIAEHVGKTVPGAKVEVLSNVAGSYNEIHWVMRAESLAQFESMMSRAESDKDYQTLSREAAKDKLFTNLVNNLYRVIA